MKHHNSVSALAALGLVATALVAPTSAGAAPVEERVPELLADIETNAVGIVGFSLAVTDAAVYFETSTYEMDTAPTSTLWRYDRSSGTTSVAFEQAGVSEIELEMGAGHLVFFSASTEETGNEPWVFDETTEAASMLADANPGPDGSYARDFVVGDLVYFTAFDVDHGRELWATKGKSSSTQRVTDIAPGSASSSPHQLVPVPTATSKRTLFFTAESAATGTELFRLDDGDVVTAIEVNSGTTGSNPQDLSLAADGALYFVAGTGSSTAAYRIGDPGEEPGLDVPTELPVDPRALDLTVVGSTAFVQTGIGNDAALWKVAGATATPEKVLDSFAGRSLSSGGSGLLFRRSGPAGVELVVSDGTSLGTVVDATVPTEPLVAPVTSVGLPGSVFVADGGPTAGAELWFTRGVAGSTEQLLDIRPGRFGSSLGSIVDGGDRWFFLADDGTNGRQLWESDGTTSGTRLLTDENTEAGGSSDPREFVEIGDRTYFTVRQPEDNSRIWFHDRTTGAVAALPSPAGVTWLGSAGVIGFGDRLVFAAETEDGGSEPWISDETIAGTKRLADTVPGPESGYPTDFTVVGDAVAFTSGSRLWIVRPGASAATQFLTGYWVPVGAFDGSLLARGCAVECGLHRVDLDSGATTLLAAGVSAGPPVSFAGVFYFIDRAGGRLFRSDGTPGGTAPVAELAGVEVWDAVALPNQLVVQQGLSFDEPSSGPRLQVIGRDGVVRPVSGPAIDVGPLELTPNAIAIDGDTLFAAGYRSGKDGDVKRSLDGDPDLPGSVFVSIVDDRLEVVADLPGQAVTWVGSVGGEVYFMTSGVESLAKQNFTGDEPGPLLWRTDGTSEGTQPIVDFRASGLLNFFDATAVDGVLYASGLATATGYEPYVFDLAPDPIAPGPTPTPTPAPSPTPGPGPDPATAGPEVVSLDPARVFASRSSDDTIDGRFETGLRLPAGEMVEIAITGRAGVEVGAQSVVMNVTAINPSGRGFITTYPCGDRPLASSLNYGAAGAVVGNELVAKLSAAGSVCVFTSAETDLSVDVVGYVPASSGVMSLDPARVYATRSSDETVDDRQASTGRIAAGDFVEVEVAGRAGVPSSGAGSVVMNITAINPSGRGFITTYPCGDRPLASSLNYGEAGAVVGNELIAKLSASGTVCVFTSAETDLTVDVVGFVPTTSAVTSLDPARVFATRSSDETVDDRQASTGRIAAGDFVEVEVAGRAGVPADGAGAVVMNITAINPSGRGFITTFPCGDRPLASSLNYGAAGAVIGNELVAKLSASGTVCVFTSAETDLSVDVVGYVPA